MDLSENIKLLRKKAGLSQVTVAERLGMTSQNYSLLENGKTELTYSKMQKLAEIFGVSVGELLGIESVGNAEEVGEVEALKNEVERLRTEAGLYKELKEKTGDTFKVFFQHYLTLSRNAIKYVEGNISPIFQGVPNVPNTNIFEAIGIKKPADAIFHKVPMKITPEQEIFEQTSNFTVFPLNLDFPPKPLDETKKYILVDVADIKFREYLIFQTPFIRNSLDFLKDIDEKLRERFIKFEELAKTYDFNVITMYKTLVNSGLEHIEYPLTVEKRNMQMIDCWEKASIFIKNFSLQGWL
jgi:transcriptional regulator with XRE-family HTH domain